MNTTKQNAYTRFAKWRTLTGCLHQGPMEDVALFWDSTGGRREDFKGCFAARGRLPFHNSLFAVPLVYPWRIWSERVSFYEGENVYRISGYGNLGHIYCTL